MNFLMLRGQVPQDRDPQEIVFDYMSKVDDVWTWLFYTILDLKTKPGVKGLEFSDYGEIWYWGGDRVKMFAPNFVERWVPSFVTYDDPTLHKVKSSTIFNSYFIPDVIFCRGGFKEYHSVLRRFPNAIKIYYGAGRRQLPQPGFIDYNIILQDSPEQVDICKQRFPNALTTLFIKPAPDNLFYPHPEIEKEYDICFPANASQDFKGHSMVYTTVPPWFNLLNLGNNPRNVKYPDNITSYRVLKSDMPKHIAKCKMGIVAVGAAIDSCPRVIAEMLACGLPIVVLDTVRFWKDKYINSVTDSKSPWATGELATRDNFWTVVEYVLNNLDKYNPRKYYEENLSLEIAAKFLRDKIDEVSV